MIKLILPIFLIACTSSNFEVNKCYQKPDAGKVWKATEALMLVDEAGTSQSLTSAEGWIITRCSF